MLTFLDVQYGPLPARRLDLYVPDDQNDHDDSLVVFVHGGAWRS